MSKILHVGCYGWEGLPGRLPYFGDMPPSPVGPNSIAALFPRIRAAGFDAVVVEIRTPYMVQHVMQWLCRFGNEHGLRVGFGWCLSDMPSLDAPEWCAQPHYGLDRNHPGLRSTMYDAAGGEPFSDDPGMAVDVMRRLAGYSDLVILNSEDAFRACADFPDREMEYPPLPGGDKNRLIDWPLNMARALANLLNVVTSEGRPVGWYWPAANQSSTSSFARSVDFAMRVAIGEWNSPSDAALVHRCETASDDALKPGNWRFVNHVKAGNVWGMTSEQVKAWSGPNDLVVSVAADQLVKVLDDMELSKS